MKYQHYKILFFLDLFFKLITKRSILVHFKDFFQNDSYKDILIFDKKSYLKSNKSFVHSAYLLHLRCFHNLNF